MSALFRAKIILDLSLKMDNRRCFRKTVKTGQAYIDTHSDTPRAINL